MIYIILNSQLIVFIDTLKTSKEGKMTGENQKRTQTIAYFGYDESAESALELMPQKGEGPLILLITPKGALMEQVDFPELPDGQTFTFADKPQTGWLEIFAKDLHPETVRAALAKANNCAPNQIQL